MSDAKLSQVFQPHPVFTSLLLIMAFACAWFLRTPALEAIPAIQHPVIGLHTPAPVVHPDTGGCEIYPLDLGSSGLHVGVLTGFEGYSDTLYQPSERSGPTIGFGLDLAHAAPGTIDYVLRGAVDGAVMRELLTARGLTGAAARRWIQAHRDIRLDSCTKAMIESRQYAHYWRSVLQQYPGAATAPSTVRTALTSFAMHTGNVEPLREALVTRDWELLETLLREHPWAGPESTWFQARRNTEADLLRLPERMPDPD